MLAVDRDISAVDVAANRLKDFGDRAQVRHARFDEIGKILDDDGRSLNGAIFDLGVSSHQLDTPERGFSHRFTSPLDMRMDPTDSLNASIIVNSYEEAELT